MWKTLLPVLALIFIYSSSATAGGPGTTNANFLKAGQGTRPIAMGETYIALGDGLDTLYWNPAGLVQLTSPEATFTHSIWVEEIGTEYLAFGTPLGPLGAIGGGVTYMHAGTIEQTLEDEFGNYAGTGGDVSAMSLALIGTYSQKLSRLLPTGDPLIKNTLVGASLRIVTESIDDVSIFGGAVDIGAIWRQTEEVKTKTIASLDSIRQSFTTKPKPGRIRDNGWRVGISAQNLGVTSDQLMPINFRTGIGYVANDVFSPAGRATFALDALIPVDNNIKLSLGTEYAHITPDTKFAARVGYKIGNEIQDLDAMAGLTAGAGFAVRAAGIRYQLDYAFVPYGDLGTTHRVSLTLGFLPGQNVVQSSAGSAGIVAPPKAGVLPPELAAPVQKKKEQVAKVEKEEPKKEIASVKKAEVVPEPTVEPTPEVVKAKVSNKKLKRALKMVMGRMKAGMLPGIAFERGTAKLSKKSKRTLAQLGKQLERYKEGDVMISGFAGQKNALAEKRAKAVVRYLKMNFRVNPDRLLVEAGDPAKKPKNSSIGLKLKKSE